MLFNARLRQIQAPEKWQAYVLKTTYPVAENQLQAYRLAVKQLLAARSEFHPPVAQEVLFQFDRFRPEDVPLLQARASEWLPDIGLGFWSHRGAPTLWTRDEFMNSTQEELRPLMHRVFRIQQEKKALESAWDTLSGTGVLLRFAVANPGEFYEAAVQYYRPQITEISFQSFPFYVPLLDGESLRNASEDDLQNWMCGATAYLRESSEDGGMLMVLRSTNDDWLTDLTAPDKAREIEWHVEFSGSR